MSNDRTRRDIVTGIGSGAAIVLAPSRLIAASPSESLAPATELAVRASRFLLTLDDTQRKAASFAWDGAAWRESWSGIAPPPGVEVTLGFESLPPDATPEQLPGEVFRRVIFLPAGQPQPPETNLVANVNSR